MKSKLNRRNFISRSSMGVMGAGIGMIYNDKIPASDPRPQQPQIREFRTLGRTGFKASDIGCGPAAMSEENLLRAVLKTGVNIIDTAEFYGNGNNEILVGKAVRDFKRESIFINTKLIISKEDTKDTIVNRTRKCLERMNIDYLDSIMLWNPFTADEIKNKSFHQAVSQLKKEGRVRYCGVSCHGTEYPQASNENMERTICGAADDGRFDLVLFVYNYVQREMGENILKECKRKNVGTLLMKTDPLGKGYIDFVESVKRSIEKQDSLKPNVLKRYEMVLEKTRKAEKFLGENEEYNKISRREAAIKFVLDNPSVSSVLISFRNYEEIAEYLRLSGSRLTSENIRQVEMLRENCDKLYCRHACGICEQHCPGHVPVNTIMRYNHYFIAQGREKYAAQNYHNLRGNKADNCKNCEGSCESACPFGVPIQTLMEIAHDNLSLGIA